MSTMSTICVVQARTGSTRLPGKVLADLGGRPMLAFMLERLRPLKVDKLVVATSSLSADDGVAEVAAAAGAAVVRGSEDDVLSRFVVALRTFPADVIVRLTADCPLIDPQVVADAMRLLIDSGADYASNTLSRTFPDGLDVEVMKARALRDADAEAVDPLEREHVTPFIYWRPQRYRLASLTTPESLGAERWTVDTLADLTWVRGIAQALSSAPNAGWREILAHADSAKER